MTGILEQMYLYEAETYFKLQNKNHMQHKMQVLHDLDQCNATSKFIADSCNKKPCDVQISKNVSCSA